MKKFIAVALSVLLLVFLTLAVMNRVSWLYFWIITIISGIFAFKILPGMK